MLIQIGDYPLHAYATMLSVAFVVGTLLAVREADKRGVWISPEVGIWVFLGALLGAKAFYIIQYQAIGELWKMFLLWRGGLVYYGGLGGGMAAAWLYVRHNKIAPFFAADVFVPYLALGQAITRVGCFLNGCCWGGVTAMPWGLRFPAGSPIYSYQVEQGFITAAAGKTLPVHPTQLYMVAGLLVIMLVLKFSLDRRRFTGHTALLYGVLYGVLRFIVEGLRGDSVRSVFGMTVSQTISLALALGCGIAMAVVLKRGRVSNGGVESGIKEEASSAPE